MNTSSIDRLLGQLRAAEAMASGKVVATPPSTAKADFSSVLKNALESVNTRQQDASRLATDFQLGVPGVALHDVMVAGQKANISLQASIQVRNRLVQAYQDVMNMPV